MDLDDQTYPSVLRETITDATKFVKLVLCDSVYRWDRTMESDEETSALLPGRGSATDERAVEDFKTVCTRVVYAITILTALLVCLSTTMYVIYFQPEAPLVEFQDIEFSEFSVSPMIDRTGVPTQGILAEAVVKVAFFNPSILYETNVKQVHGSLSFTRTIAHGEGERLKVPRQSGRVIQLRLISNNGLQEPLYGAAPLLLGQMNQRGSADLLLEFQLESEYSMFHGMVRKVYTASIRCQIGFIPATPDLTPGHHGGVILNQMCSRVRQSD